mmetsp:Transcript_17663/g.36166  ORF Transcript_17663/g.36166 Transcript_17663/m.36166 type:complete len:280 (+) Transcript_17663:256-1095(+)
MHDEMVQVDLEVSVGESELFAYILAVLYLSLGATALVQLIRIQLRLPEYGWTTQKVFHLLNVMCLFARGALFFIFPDKWLVNIADPPTKPLFYYVTFLLPGQIYFTTYTLLILFWAEIYHQARSLPLKHLRPSFFAFNALVYAVPLAISVAQTRELAAHNDHARAVLKYAMTGVMCAVWLSAAAGFVFYGGRLFVMLRRFPLESKGRRKKLQEVGMVAGVSTTSFVVRAGLFAVLAFVKTSQYMQFAYFLVVEIVPVAIILLVLRKLPPKRQADGYHRI